MKPEEQIEFQILQVLHKHTPFEYRYGYYFTFRFITLHTELDREVVRGFCRSMRNKGLVEYGTGFDEDGLTSGGGYSLTKKGELHRKGLVQEVPDDAA